ncbi:Uncharacterized protein conserved in bacteria [Streptococcus pneumoniae]|nr:Uncharacterized protein conserved in bacteria [Streptococcus pneumoniae]
MSFEKMINATNDYYLSQGYSAFDLGLFSDKDPRLKLIKKAIRKDLEAMAADGVSWLVFTGTLGFEYWVLEVAQEMKTEYGFQLATIFNPFCANLWYNRVMLLYQ